MLFLFCSFLFVFIIQFYCVSSFVNSFVSQLMEV